MSVNEVADKRVAIKAICGELEISQLVMELATLKALVKTNTVVRPTQSSGHEATSFGSHSL